MADDLSTDEVDSLSKAMGDEAVATDNAEPTAAAPEEPSPSSEGPPPPAPSADNPDANAKPGQISKAQFMQLEEVAAAADLPPADLKRMRDIKVDVEVLLGTTSLPLEEILKIQPGSVVELNRLAGEPVDILANDQLIARAEVVVVDDNFGVKILEITGTAAQLKATMENATP